jgi:hypothetical protein
MSCPLNIKLTEILHSIDIPDGAYEAAKKRYEDLGEWLEQDSKSKTAQFNPHVFPQGSFRLGTAIKPIGDDDYDLDLACKFQDGASKMNCTQQQLKELLGDDLETYRNERGIKSPLESKHRCWRLLYKDDLGFHMDTVPCIPEDDVGQEHFMEGMINTGTERELAETVSKHAVSITDDREDSYPVISPDWNPSNPEGYAQWFEYRMRQAESLLESRVSMENYSKVDDLPVYKWRTPLQQCVQILKQHRDLMYKDDSDRKPISIIITTLAAKAYEGEEDLANAMRSILSKMGSLVKTSTPRVANPVNEAEDFADKWPTAEGLRLELEDNFWKWLEQAQEDFSVLESSEELDSLLEHAQTKFGAMLNRENLKAQLGIGGITVGGTGLADHVPENPVDPRGGGRFGRN